MFAEIGVCDFPKTMDASSFLTRALLAVRPFRGSSGGVVAWARRLAWLVLSWLATQATLEAVIAKDAAAAGAAEVAVCPVCLEALPTLAKSLSYEACCGSVVCVACRERAAAADVTRPAS